MANYSPKPGSNRASGASSPNDPFSQLVPSSSSKSASRSLTPANPARPSPLASQNGLDAFSSLLGPSFSLSTNQEKLSLAARRAAAQKETEARAALDRESKKNESAAWSGLDMLGHGLSNTNSGGEKKSAQSIEDDWIFSDVKPVVLSSSKPATSSAPSDLIDDWGLSDFASHAQGPVGTQNQQQHARKHEAASLIDTLDSGDLIPDSFGGSRTTPVNVERGEELDDDILGALGKPVAVSKQSSLPPQPAAPASVTPQGQNKGTRSNSPPPHILGQIVEMGFSPEQARLALASTDTGIDVQQALDALISNGVGVDQELEPVQDRPRRRSSDLQDEDWEEHGQENQHVQRPAQRQTPSSSGASRTQKQTQSLIGEDIQERADKLLAQASEIGLTVFSRANALWKDGKEKMQKVYEERQTKNRQANGGKPRWMAEIPADGEGRIHGGKAPASSDSFRDDDDVRENLSRPPMRQRHSQQDRAVVDNAPKPPVLKIGNLFDEEPAVYASPARRRPVPSRTTSQNPPSTALNRTPPPRERQSTPPLRVRQAVSASPSAISTSNAHKAKGTEFYKLGQYANAEQAYSTAIELLPANHLLLVPLYNNRALSRIKIGEHSGAVEDCTTVVSIIGPDYHPAREAKVTREEEGASVDLADALLKAFRRRAEAYEGREKWDLALKDWEALIACEWSAKMRSDAFAGSSRCRKMLTPEKVTHSHGLPASRPVPRPAVTKPQQDFEAVKKLRQANQALEQEEQAKANLKDSVDARLLAWKAGKETNVRALVASLENVLWPELGWQKVGLHELVAPNQVKIRYMKAIAKLHPDKINSSNTTVEQRMIANGVFAALNEAWTAFKQ
ncbi:SWA2 [Sanghuangporus vaninii]